MMFDEDLTNGEIEVLSLYMVVAWYDSQINSLEHTNMFYGSKDEKWTSPEGGRCSLYFGYSRKI